jgi:hypothetical protein
VIANVHRLDDGKGSMLQRIKEKIGVTQVRGRRRTWRRERHGAGKNRGGSKSLGSKGNWYHEGRIWTKPRFSLNNGKAFYTHTTQRYNQNSPWSYDAMAFRGVQSRGRVHGLIHGEGAVTASPGTSGTRRAHEGLGRRGRLKINAVFANISWWAFTEIKFQGRNYCSFPALEWHHYS